MSRKTPDPLQPLELQYRHTNPLRTLYRLFDIRPRFVAGGMTLFLLKTLPVWLIPYMTGKIINVATYPDQYSTDRLWLLTGILTLVIIQNIPAHVGFTVLVSKAIRSMELRVRSALVRRIQLLSISFHDDFESGRLHSKMLRDVESLEMLAQQLTQSVLQGIIVVAVALTITLVTEPLVVLFYVLTIPVGTLLIRGFGKSIRNRTSEFRNEIEEMSAHMSDMIEMIPVTRAHGVEDQEIERMHSRLEQVKDRGYRLDFLNALFGSTTWVSFCLFQVACLIFTSAMAYHGRIRIGDVVMFQAYFGMIIGSVNMVLNIYPALIRGFESIKSIGEILESPDVEANQGKDHVPEVQGSLRFENVSFAYPGTNRHAVSDFSLDVSPGECIAFVGESGSGKSTLMNLVIGFRRPDKGRILLDGRDMEELDLRAFRRHIAVVPQHTILFSGSVRENITYGLETCSEEQLREAVQQANAEDFISQLPQGLDSSIGEHGSKLSGGQRQRIAIARAIIRDPKIIILDEATSALDVHSEKLVQDAIDHLVRNRTTFIVAHRLSTIRNATRIVVMKNGGCVEMGSQEELLARQGEFYRLKNLQS